MQTMKSALFFILLCFGAICRAGDAHEIFYQAFHFAKKESPFSQNINWNRIERKALQFIGKEEQACRGTSAISHILAPALSRYDFHTFVTEEGLGDIKCPTHQPDKISHYWQDWMQLNSDTRSFIKEKVDSFWGKRFGDIAYLYVPSGFAYSDDALEAKTRQGRMVIESLNLETASGIIVDFRMNTGGHYFPMLMSLAKILNSQTLFQYTNGESIHLSEDGNALISLSPDGTKETLYQVTYLPPVHRVTLPMVILVDEGTASSGAISAFALKENSSRNRLLGERTSPTLSVNTSLPLKDGNYFNLMILKLLSPAGIENPLYLDVDFKLDHDFNTMFGPNDPSIARAIELLDSMA
jgi:hypothetical protein